MTTTPSLTLKKKCYCCNRKRGLLTLCKYCNNHYCFNCLQYEIHNCEQTETMKENKRRNLQEKLENERCVKVKLETI